MAQLALMPPKLGKLLPLLGSDQDGEILAAVAAMSRVLRDAGLDWLDLARAFVTAPAAGTATPAAVMVDALWKRSSVLNAKENAFIGDMKIATLNHQTPSPKQAAWIEALYRRVVGL